MAVRLPVPGPSFLRERTIRLHAGPSDPGGPVALGIGRLPTGRRAVGPVFAAPLAGLIGEENGRQLVRLKPHPAADETQPWERPLIVQLAIRWDPVRAATMRPNALATEALEAFARAIQAAGRPG